MKNTNKAFTLIELGLTIFGAIGLIAVGAMFLSLVANSNRPITPPYASTDYNPPFPSVMPSAQAETQAEAPVPTNGWTASDRIALRPISTAHQSEWGYIPEDGHKAFWIWGLFFPRLTILFTHMNGIPLPHSPIGYWWKWWMALLVPRVLFIVWLFQNGLQQSLWMILHVLFLIGAYCSGNSYRSSRR